MMGSDLVACLDKDSVGRGGANGSFGWLLARVWFGDIVRSSSNAYLHKLVKVKRPLSRIPTLAIHLDRVSIWVYCKHQQRYQTVKVRNSRRVEEFAKKKEWMR